MHTLKALTRLYLYLITIFMIGRLALFILYYDRFSNIEGLYRTFLYALRIDTVAAFTLLIIPMFVMTLLPRKRATHIFLKLYLSITFALAIFIEVATFAFFAQFDLRPNYLFVEYLKYPKEVASMIVADHPIDLLIAFGLIGLFVLWFNKRHDYTQHVQRYLMQLLWVFPLIIIFFIGIRSSFGHRPINPSDLMFSNNRILTEVTNNSIYSILYAIYAHHKYQTSIKEYGTMKLDEALQRSKQLLKIQNDTMDVTRFAPSHFKDKEPKNLVIFLQESLGYQFVSPKITPNLMQLRDKGIWFNQLYSNGTRSIRGIAGVTSGIFSIPGTGVLKRSKSQYNFFTVAKLLKQHNYKSYFFYGGESRFDNMKGWFRGNGFDQIIEQSDFKNPSFIGTWGVSDDEVVARADKEFQTLHNQKQKFVSVIFSTSNHTPFDFPEGKIKLLPNYPKKSVENAIKFADYAIGELISKAKKSGYYDDTIFLIVADHNVRVYGDDIVPIDMFHIPALILGGGVKAQSYNPLTTQPDLLATAVDLMGIEGEYPIMGNSIFGDKTSLSFLQFHSSYALRVGNEIAIIRPNIEPKSFIYQNKKLLQTQANTNLQKDALALIVTLDYLYNKQLFR